MTASCVGRALAAALVALAGRAGGSPPGETHLLFERGGRKLRVLVTPGEPGSEVLVLGDVRE
jgi:hypothetical protein